MKKTILLFFTAFLSCFAAHPQKKGDKEQYNTIENTTGKPTIGLGMIEDTSSHMYYQYAFYSLLNDNPISKNDAIFYPVLTLRRGLTSYFIEGIYSKNDIELKLWEKNSLLQVIHLKPNEVIDEAPGEADLLSAYKEITKSISGKAHEGKIKLKIPDAFQSLDRLVDKDVGNVGTFIYNSALNHIPEIDFKKDLCLLYSDGTLETEYDELKDLKGKNFKYKSLEDYIDKMYPGLTQLFQTPKYYPRNSLEQAQVVSRLYRLKQSEHFFFTSKFVDDRAKIACRKVAFPLWRRPGTVVTYYQAGQNFLTAGYSDAAIECFYSALAMSDAINAFPKFVYYMKAKIYDGLANAQSKLGNTASAKNASLMKELYQNLMNTKTVADRDKEFKKLSSEVSNYFVKMETNAYTARSEKRSAFWNTITSVVAVTASAANDGLNGLNTLSPETQSLITVASENADVSGNFKINSLASSAEAATAFNETYGSVVMQLQKSNTETAIASPLISLDFIKRLGDKELSLEKQDAFLTYSTSIPSINQSIINYFNAASDSEKTNLLGDIFKKLAAMELTISIKESMGEKPDVTSLSKL